MKKKHRYILFLLIWALSISCVFSLPAKAESQQTIDVMYMIDVSGSIIGLPKGAGNEDILQPLLEALTREIRNSRTGTRVFVMTFAEGLHDVDGSKSRYSPLWQKRIGEETERRDKGEIITYVMGLNQAVRTEIGVYCISPRKGIFQRLYS